MPFIKRGVYIGSMFYIYGLVRTSTNELVYVGITATPEQRFKSHKCSTVKDLKGDCHMIIIEQGIDLTTTHEHFWIEYMRYLGCNLRNRRIKISHEDYGKRYKGCTYALPHLVQDMAERGISVEDMATVTRLGFSCIVNARNGLKLYPWAAYRIDRVLSIGTAIFDGLSDRRWKNLLYGWTSPEYVRRENRRRGIGQAKMNISNSVTDLVMRGEGR